VIPLPTRRWYLGALLLAPAWGLALIHPDGVFIAAALDLAWVVVFLLDVMLAPDLAALGVERDPPAAFSVGRPLPIRYRWRNPTSRLARVTIRESFPAPLHTGPTPARSVVIPPLGTATEWITLTPRRRGEGSGGMLWVRVRGPLGLADSRSRRDLPWTALVFPDLTEAALRALPTRIQRRREAGLRSVRHLGEGRVFETLKEWVPGDDTRSIDWKATARRGKVMARRYEDERRQQVLILLDAGRMLTAEIDGRARLESAIDAALLLAYGAVDHDDDVGLLVFADTIQHFLPPRRGRRALKAVVEALARTEGRLVEPDYPGAFAFLAAHNRKRALTVLFTDVIDRTASDAMLTQVATLRPRHLPLAVTLRDPAMERAATAHAATSADAFRRAAAEELLGARAEALAQMRGRGVLTLDVPPAHAARSVVEQYDRLKRRGLL
jgi:uncharacterized protein (DUF58 family)